MKLSRLPKPAKNLILQYSGFYGCLLLNHYETAKQIRNSNPLYMEVEIKYENASEPYLKCVIHFNGEWKFGIVKSDTSDLDDIKWMIVSNYDSLSTLLHQPISVMFSERNETVILSCWYSFEPLKQSFSMGTYAFIPKRVEKCSEVLNTFLSTYIQIDSMKLAKKTDSPLLTINNMAIGCMYYKEFVIVREIDEETYLCIYFNHDSQLIELMGTLLLHHKQKFHISSDFTTNLWPVGFGKQREFANALQSLKETKFSYKKILTE
eukprot:NODE_72_length_23514_cov_0.560624.p10 type:complete len:264 gc:universal NODE_72_length_23514_cov_0.560624:20453-21244(+)